MQQDLKVFDVELIPICKRLLEENPKALLSGSIALYLQKKPVRRHIKDIDIFLPFGEKFIIPEGVIVDKVAAEKEYDEEYFERKVFINKSGPVNIDVFSPVDETVFKLEQFFDYQHMLRMVWWADILKMKLLHSFDDKFSKYKHRQDLIFSLLE